MYYLSIQDAIIKSEFTAIKFINSDETGEVTSEFDSDNKMIVVTLHPNTTYKDVNQWLEPKAWISPEQVVVVNPGVYKLYTPLRINGFDMILSDWSLSCTINQYLCDNTVIAESSIRKERNTIIIMLLEGITIPEYVNMINNSGYFYIMNAEEPEINSIIGIQTNARTNNVSIKNKRKQVIRHYSILIETADYITALILTLQQYYPEVQFYNEDYDLNDTTFKEFIKYKANPEGMDGDIHTSVLMSDPIYGEVIRTNCHIEFEYMTNDIARFNRRKFDFMINRFISNIGKCELPFPETDRKLTFNVHFDRNEPAGNNPYSKEQSISSSQKYKYTFKFNGRLTVTLYRLSGEYPVIKDPKFNTTPHFLPPGIKDFK